ncbi:hypothetical protein D3C81_1603060 [compost metagenome]
MEHLALGVHRGVAITLCFCRFPILAALRLFGSVFGDCRLRRQVTAMLLAFEKGFRARGEEIVHQTRVGDVAHARGFISVDGFLFEQADAFLEFLGRALGQQPETALTGDVDDVVIAAAAARLLVFAERFRVGSLFWWIGRNDNRWLFWRGCLFGRTCHLRLPVVVLSRMPACRCSARS